MAVLKIKEGGTWINIPKVYKKEYGIWVEQDSENWSTLFSSDTIYTKKVISIPTATLYSDGTFVFSNDMSINNSYGDVISTYHGWDTDVYDSDSNVPWYANRLKIKKICFNNIVEPISILHWFYCSNVKEIDFSNLNTNNITSLNKLFINNPSLESLDLSGFNTSNVTDMSSMINCEFLTSINLSGFNTSRVTNMSNMFRYCKNLASLNLSSFDTSNVIDMYNMFRECSSLTYLDLSNFNTSNVTNMETMFMNCRSLTSLDLSNFNTSKVYTMRSMFQNCTSLTSLDLSNFDMSKVTDTDNMFTGCTNSNLTIYVKDETTKTKIESSLGFPSTATVVIGSMN